jgi:hypothetical protein
MLSVKQIFQDGYCVTALSHNNYINATSLCKRWLRSTQYKHIEDSTIKVNKANLIPDERKCTGIYVHPNMLHVILDWEGRFYSYIYIISNPYFASIDEYQIGYTNDPETMMYEQQNDDSSIYLVHCKYVHRSTACIRQLRHMYLTNPDDPKWIKIHDMDSCINMIDQM